MKRFYLSLVLLAAMLSICAYSYFLFDGVSHEMLSKLNEIETYVDTGEDDAVIIEKCRQYSLDWRKKEKKLMRFIRHPQLDEISSKSAELPYLALDSENRSHLLAAIASIKVNIERVGGSETFMG